MKIMTVLFFTAGSIALAGGTDSGDPAPQSKNQIQNEGSSEPPSDTHVVGVSPITTGAGAQSSSELDSGNAPAMGVGLQFNIFKPKESVAPDPDPSQAPAPIENLAHDSDDDQLPSPPPLPANTR
jgi:hypothetical protein